MLVKAIKLDADGVEFDNKISLYSEHESDCCESHYLSFADLTLEDFEDLQFDFFNEPFFRKVEDYGIELLPINGYPIRVPGYGFNNGYYSTNLTLVLETPEGKKKYDISECQDIKD